MNSKSFSKEPSKVAIIGSGSVGSTAAYACILLRACPMIMMVDIDEARNQAEVADLSDAAFISDAKVKAGTLKEAGQCDVIVITAGKIRYPF